MPHHAINDVAIKEKNIKTFYKTYSVNGNSYEFNETTGKEFDPEFDAAIPFIKGTITKLKAGKVITKSKVLFGHAVVY